MAEEKEVQRSEQFEEEVIERQEEVVEEVIEEAFEGGARVVETVRKSSAGTPPPSPQIKETTTSGKNVRIIMNLRYYSTDDSQDFCLLSRCHILLPNITFPAKQN